MIFRISYSLRFKFIFIFLFIKSNLKVKKEEDIIDLLVEMNVNWAEGKWRDFGEPTVRYSHQAELF